MSELPAWVDPAQMQLDTRFDAQGRWVSGPVNDAAVPKPVDAQLIEGKKFATDAEVEQIISRVMG